MLTGSFDFYPISYDILPSQPPESVDIVANKLINPGGDVFSAHKPKAQ
jgi:hypothetical protein